MLTDILNSLKQERATFARNLAYVKEMAKEDFIDDKTMAAESSFVSESADYTDIKAMVQAMPTDYVEEDANEIERIMEATEDMSFDQMIGIE